MTSRSSLGKSGADLALQDLAQGLDACIEIVCKAQENRSAWKLRRWAMALLRYVSRPSCIDGKMKKAKTYFALCREIAVTGDEGKWGDQPPVPSVPGSSKIERRTLLHQVSRVSRCLREAGSDLVSESLKDHWELSQSVFETPQSQRNSFKRFLRNRFSADSKATWGGVGSAASFLRKKCDGGAAQEIKEITDTFREQELTLLELKELAAKVPGFIGELVTKVADLAPLEPKVISHKKARLEGWLPRYRVDTVFFLYDKNSELSLEDWEVARERLFSLTASWFAIDFSKLPSCRQVAIKERGYKVRVATPLEAPFRYLLSIINGALLAKLEECPQTTSALHGCPAEELDWSLGRKTNLVFSADLKAATDHFPHDLMFDAADELSGGWPDELRALFLRAVGPHLLSNTQGQEVQTSRGILMGSPVSWPLLSMYSAWLHCESGSDGWHAVCGDDYIGCHTYGTYRRYLAERTATGGIGSVGKDILGTCSIGVFAEELVSVGRCRWIPTVSVRAVLGDPKSGLPAWSQGPEVSEALRKLHWPRSDENRLCERLHKSQINMLRRNKIDPFAPRWAGGAGFPGTPHSGTLLCARRMMSQSHGQITTWVTRLEAAWTTSATSSSLVDAVAEDVNRYVDIQWDTGIEGEWGPLSDVISSRLGSLSWAFFLAGAEKRSWRLGLSQVCRKVSSVKEEIARKGYWVPTGEEIVRPEGLAEALQKLEPLSRPIPFQPTLPKLLLAGRSREPFLARKRPSGPGSPLWGKRKRARLV